MKNKFNLTNKGLEFVSGHTFHYSFILYEFLHKKTPYKLMIKHTHNNNMLAVLHIDRMFCNSVHHYTYSILLTAQVVTLPSDRPKRRKCLHYYRRMKMRSRCIWTVMAVMLEKCLTVLLEVSPVPSHN